MKHNTIKTGNEWVVARNGQLTLIHQGNVIFDIEPETLQDKDKFYFLSLLPEIDEYEFLKNWINACKAANIKELTITIQK